MDAVIDLSPRQASRVLEQALRMRATLEIEPRTQASEEPLLGRVAAQDGTLLRVDMLEGTAALPLHVLIGAFCDVRLMLGEQMYLFSTCIIDVLEPNAPQRLMLAVPETVHVANRRRWERRQLSEFAQVRLWPNGSMTPYIGELCNVSGDGLACRMMRGDLEELLLVGDHVRVAFTLADSGEQFDLPAIVCTKTAATDGTQLVVGMEFRHQPSDLQAGGAIERLRTVLCDLTSGLAEKDGEA